MNVPTPGKPKKSVALSGVAAGDVAAEIAAMPGPEVALGRIEEIARRR